MEEKTKTAHSFSYSNGVLALTGVKEVIGFSEKEVEIALFNRGISVKGRDLKVASFDRESGNLRVEGALDGLNYTTSQEKLSFVKRLFK
ncbi:MAG: YabP/YqfC family sporulation protein [Clostridia bacterium]|nr:YabP/YqfC family sporulation protein [Clostridia bacterium]